MPISVGIALLAALAQLSATRPAATVLEGEYQADCGPNDVSGVLITLSAPEQEGEFRLRANAPLARIAGRWHHAKEFGLRPGSATILLCRKTPDLKCDYPEDGTFTVTGKPGARIGGSFEASFPGSIRQAFRFTAMPARSAEPLLCG